MKFDENQLEAIKSLGNTLVVAGAGSGKTSTIVGKINYLIENNIYTASEILVISFTNETVKSLKDKVSHDVNIKTFHKLALDIINQNNEKISICPDNYLDFIIDEFLNSYALDNKKTNTIYKQILNNENNLSLFIKTYINLYKSNYSDIYDLFRLYKKSIFLNRSYYKLLLEIYLVYSRELESTKTYDFSDMINIATKLITDSSRNVPYKFIIIDEFQDTSLIRFKLIMSIIEKNNANLFVVGDDYQSIYRFSGCNLSLFINFKKYLPNTKIIKLNNNYRNNQSLINIANQFIMKNKKQIPKETICHKDSKKPIKVIFYVDKKTVIHKVSKKVTGNILILGRNNADQKHFNIEENSNVRFLTIHKSKGLEEDNVILVNLYNSTLGLPSKVDNNHLISKLMKNDYIIHAEERRLFYVALTRTKNFIYLLVPTTNYSEFIREIIHDHKNNIEFMNID